MIVSAGVWLRGWWCCFEVGGGIAYLLADPGTSHSDFPNHQMHTSFCTFSSSVEIVHLGGLGLGLGLWLGLA